MLAKHGAFRCCVGFVRRAKRWWRAHHLECAFFLQEQIYARQTQRPWKTAARQVPQTGKKIVLCVDRSYKTLPETCPVLPIFERFSAHHLGNTAFLPCWIFQHSSGSQIFHPRLVLGVALSKSVCQILPVHRWIYGCAERLHVTKQSLPCGIFLSSGDLLLFTKIKAQFSIL